MDLRRRLSLLIPLTLICLLALPAQFALLSPALINAPALAPDPLDEALDALGIRDELYGYLADLGLISPDVVCAQAGCQAWYCDRVIRGQCYQRNRDGSYSPTNPVGCVGNCSGGSGDCSSGACPDGSNYRCCARPGSGGCGSLIRGVRGSDCCSGLGEETPTPVATQTPPPCNGERIDLFPPRGDYEQDPPHAVVVGQDPSVRGFDLELDLRGGRAERWTMENKRLCDVGGGEYPDACADGPWHWSCVWELQERYDDPIVRVEVGMRLADSTVAWIDGELHSRYPGSRRTEPLPHVFTAWEGRAMAVREDWNYLPNDPGIHGGRIIITTAGTPISEPQVVSLGFEVHVFLKDTTLWEYR